MLKLQRTSLYSNRRGLSRCRSCCLRSTGGIAVNSPHIFLYVRLEADLLLGAGTEWPGPNHAKFRFVLAVLKYDQAANFELAPDCAQANSVAADVEGMDEFGIGFAGTVTPRNSHR